MSRSYLSRSWYPGDESRGTVLEEVRLMYLALSRSMRDKCMRYVGHS